MPTVGMSYAVNDNLNAHEDNQDLLPLLSVPVGANPSEGGAGGEGHVLLVGDTDAAARTDYAGAAAGCLLINSEAGKLYVNTGTTAAATWTLAKDVS